MAKTKVMVDAGDPPVDKVILAKAIVDASAAMKRLAASGLNQKAIRLLVSHSSGVNQTQVKCVLDSLEQLAADYTAK
jgi:hypothetical protein